MNRLQGLVIGLQANRPTVRIDGGEEVLCYLRGKIKTEHGRIRVGDRVEVELTDPGEGMIVSVAPRQNELLRPPMANVDGLWVIFTLRQPQGNRELLDKRLVMAHLSGMRAEVVINKIDETPRADWEPLASVYRSVGYPVWAVSVVEGIGLQELLERKREGIWVMTGESGVGKSSLLNAVLPRAAADAGALGRGGRGQQTTRTVKIWPINGFWLADTPGYSALEIAVDRGVDISRAFPEFDAFACRYSDCLHRSEPDCGVLKAVAAGAVDPIRYRHYLLILDQWVTRR